jgi:hypothetical protein
MKMTANKSADVAASLERESVMSARQAPALRLVHSNDSLQVKKGVKRLFGNDGSARRPYSDFWRGGLRRFLTQREMFAPFRVY